MSKSADQQPPIVPGLRDPRPPMLVIFGVQGRSNPSSSIPLLDLYGAKLLIEIGLLQYRHREYGRPRESGGLLDKES